jgi:hypothetical protein
MTAAESKTGRRCPAAASGAAGWLGLAAAPTFAAMALLTSMPGGETDMMGMAGHGSSALNGMATMYALMSAFHLPPWLKRISRRRSEGRASNSQRTPGARGKVELTG